MTDKELERKQERRKQIINRIQDLKIRQAEIELAKCQLHVESCQIDVEGEKLNKEMSNVDTEIEDYYDEHCEEEGEEWKKGNNSSEY